MIDMDTVPLVMTTEEAAAILRASPKTVAGYVHAHKLVAIQIGPERRIRGVDLIEFVDSQRSTCRPSNGSQRR